MWNIKCKDQGVEFVRCAYRGTSLIRNSRPLKTYSRTMPRALGGWAFSYERGTPAHVGHGPLPGVRVHGSGLMIPDLGARAQDSGCRVWGSGFRVQGVRCRVKGVGFSLQASGFRMCEDRVLDGPASGGKGSTGGPYMYCNPRM